MKKLEKFMADINEDNVNKEETFDGKKEKDVAELNPKTDDKTTEPYAPDDETMSKNERRVQTRIERGQPFFIIGHAGWAKSSIVKRVAKRCGYKILVVNLDKACKEDLGGIPTPVKGNDGRSHVEYLPMPWMEKIINNPDTNFLLFFDEMNQAEPEVQNALMPIVQDHTLAGIEDIMNYLPCGAGNYKSENKAVHEMNGPLMSRFKPLIIWEDNNEAAWEDTFRYYHKAYDEILGKKFIDDWWKYHVLFDNPRELNEKIWDQYIKVKKQGLGNAARYKPEYIAEEIAGEAEDGSDSILKKDIDPRDRKKYSREMAELIHDWLTNSGDAEAKKTTRGRKPNEKQFTIPDDIKKLLRSGIVKGYINGKAYGLDNTKYAVSEENVYGIFDPNEINPEAIRQFIKHEAALGNTFKYKTTDEAMSALKGAGITVIDASKAS